MTTPQHFAAGSAWKTSSYSGPNNECVEVARAGAEVGVRDSKVPDSPIVVTSAAAFTTMLGALESGAL
ncbi:MULTISPECIES: DUF397 domain-containing protein [unclassified Streptomyces]|uniref:DUF397 domain-containing protein n=1 Tax=unclassified Streptomyces TaxID=2593676 RepID=UPI0035E0143D